MYLEAQGDDIWNVVKNGPVIPTNFVDNTSQPKIKTSWTDDDTK